MIELIQQNRCQLGEKYKKYYKNKLISKSGGL